MILHISHLFHSHPLLSFFLLFSVSLALSIDLLSFILISYLLIFCVFVFPTCSLMFLLVKEITLFLPIEYGCFLYHTVCIMISYLHLKWEFLSCKFSIHFLFHFNLTQSPNPRKSDLISCHGNDTQYLSPAIDIFSHSKIQNRSKCIFADSGSLFH